MCVGDLQIVCILQKGLEHLQILLSYEDPGSNPLWIERNNYIFIFMFTSGLIISTLHCTFHQSGFCVFCLLFTGPEALVLSLLHIRCAVNIQCMNDEEN